MSEVIDIDFREGVILLLANSAMPGLVRLVVSPKKDFESILAGLDCEAPAPYWIVRAWKSNFAYEDVKHLRYTFEASHQTLIGIKHPDFFEASCVEGMEAAIEETAELVMSEAFPGYFADHLEKFEESGYRLWEALMEFTELRNESYEKHNEIPLTERMAMEREKTGLVKAEEDLEKKRLALAKEADRLAAERKHLEEENAKPVRTGLNYVWGLACLFVIFGIPAWLITDAALNSLFK